MDDIKKILIAINSNPSETLIDDNINRSALHEQLVSLVNDTNNKFNKFFDFEIIVTQILLQRLVALYSVKNDLLFGVTFSLPGAGQNVNSYDPVAEGNVRNSGNARAATAGNPDTSTPVNSDETKIYTEKALNENPPVLAIRNRNPLNLRPSSPPWDGQIGVASGFVQFKSFEMGLRANYINMASKYRQGDTTIAALIDVWAPETENPTENYINSVTTYTGEGRNTEIDFNDPGFMAKLATAMARVEAEPWRVNAEEFYKFATQVYSKYSDRIKDNLSS